MTPRSQRRMKMDTSEGSVVADCVRTEVVVFSGAGRQPKRWIIAYTMLKNSRSYQDLGGDYLKQINKHQLQRYFVKRLQKLGLTVTIEPAIGAA